MSFDLRTISNLLRVFLIFNRLFKKSTPNEYYKVEKPSEIITKNDKKKNKTSYNRNYYNKEFENKVLIGTSKLRALGYILEVCNDYGMHKYASVSNGKISFGFSYDRGYIECIIEIRKCKFIDLIQLVNFFHFDNNKYNGYDNANGSQEDKIVKYYENIIILELNKLTTFILTATDDDIKEYEDWSSIKSAEYWKQIFIKKGKPLPESLKKRLEGK